MRGAVGLKGVTFAPYIGEAYRTSQLKVLILGESHYGPRDQDASLSEVTTRAVGDGSEGFFRKVRDRLGETSAFWQQIAFYNYVQQFAGPKPRQRPTDEMWACSHVAFGTVLKDLQPDRILVLGKTTWLNMADEEQDCPGMNVIPEWNFRLGLDFVRNTPTGHRCARWYPTLEGKYALAAAIFHPAYPHGFCLSETKRTAIRLLSPDWKLVCGGNSHRDCP